MRLSSLLAFGELRSCYCLPSLQVQVANHCQWSQSPAAPRWVSLGGKVLRSLHCRRRNNSTCPVCFLYSQWVPLIIDCEPEPCPPKIWGNVVLRFPAPAMQKQRRRAGVGGKREMILSTSSHLGMLFVNILFRQKREAYILCLCLSIKYIHNYIYYINDVIIVCNNYVFYILI